MASELLLRYHGRSSVSQDSVRFATTAETLLFDGYAEQPIVTAQALLCVSRIAATRFYEPPNMVAARIRHADPVVTAEPERLRFESFSQCGGVHARLDLLPAGLDVGHAGRGTTNVDFGEAMSRALDAVTRRDPLRLTVGTESVEVTTADQKVTERRVSLPERWVKGFGEVQVAVSDAVPVLHLDALGAQRFLLNLPRGKGGRMTYWTDPAGASVRLVPRPTPGGVTVAAPARLQTLQPLAPFADSLIAYTHPQVPPPSTVTWVLHWTGGRLSLTLSPDWKRGFAGEGGMLFDLASPDAATDAATVRSSLTDVARFSADTAAVSAGLATSRARPALTWLGAHGQLGRDAPDAAFFWRHLPYPQDILSSDPPRLTEARTLVEAGAITQTGADMYTVTSGQHTYRVSTIAPAPSCTCPWIARNGHARGPCKHILAAKIATRTPTIDTR